MSINHLPPSFLNLRSTNTKVDLKINLDIDNLEKQIINLKKKLSEYESLLSEIAEEAHDYEKRTGNKIQGDWLTRADLLLSANS